MEINADTPDQAVDAFLFGAPQMPPIAIAKDVQTFRVEDTPEEVLTAIEAEPMTDDPTDEEAIAAIRARMRERAIWHSMQHGMTQAEAEALADEALNSPPAAPLPTFDELSDPC